MTARALLICRNDYWPSLTPDRLWELPYAMWARLAVACDAIAAQRAADVEEIKRMSRNRG
ncbi:hypothetical protein [Microbacterium allomyrinae]|uniref:Uncharacterized protein n=1 Tax=Microbacterium allomyrinae TaxID=2830666 RepID=A0A9X1S1T0_9MICO|nr:hypothetical protein [Microbacterium allomyrinae]MCC2030612.1 hypothetical protein [Microbacterium allomyrinae]